MSDDRRIHVPIARVHDIAVILVSIVLLGYSFFAFDHLRAPQAGHASVVANLHPAPSSVPCKTTIQEFVPAPTCPTPQAQSSVP